MQGKEEPRQRQRRVPRPALRSKSWPLGVGKQPPSCSSLEGADPGELARPSLPLFCWSQLSPWKVPGGLYSITKDAELRLQGSHALNKGELNQQRQSLGKIKTFHTWHPLYYGLQLSNTPISPHSPPGMIQQQTEAEKGRLMRNGKRGPTSDLSPQRNFLVYPQSSPNSIRTGWQVLVLDCQVNPQAKSEILGDTDIQDNGHIHPEKQRTLTVPVVCQVCKALARARSLHRVCLSDL